MFNNPILNTDSYKISHWKQLPPNTEFLYSYFESRGGEFNETVFFGLEYFLRNYISKTVTQEDVEYAAKRFALHFGDESLFNRAGWEYIVRIHNGKLPLKIKAVPEGTVVPTGNVMMTVVNTDPALPWLTNYVETILSQLWYPTTVATNSREIKKTIARYLEKTGDPAGLPFKLHDFGFRGVSSPETAALGGAAHLVNFLGTDTMVGYEMALIYYGEEMAGFSIPAAEHSTITSWGKENEVDAYRNMVRQFGSGGGGIYAVVSDSYDIYKACRELWGEQLKDEVIAAGNMLVVRPDSGNPPEVVSEVLSILGDKFGYEVNDKGYKVLNHVRVIQGDGIDRHMVNTILNRITLEGWSADNLAFGSGGGLLQKFDRDTCKFAFKCCAVRINNEWVDVWKNPVTSKMKSSKRGRMKLIDDKGVLRTTDYNDIRPDVMVVRYNNGEIFNSPSFSEVRDNASI